MSVFFSSPLLWRMLGGFAVGTVLTLGLGVVGEPAAPPSGVTLEVQS